MTSFREQDITFLSAGTILAGTLTMPDDQTIKGAILLLSGSGPQNRDEELAGQKPFQVLSRFLAEQGFAVLRWDDRGEGGSEGDYQAGSENTLVQDVRAAIEYLKAKTGANKVTLIGHSQGTLIAAKVAADYPDEVCAVILVSGMVRQGQTVLLEQHVRILEEEGFEKDIIEHSTNAKRALFKALIDAEQKIEQGGSSNKELKELSHQLEHILLEGADYASLSKDEQEEVDFVVDDLMEWEWRYLLTKDPAEDLTIVKCPILAIVGDSDTQVNAEAEINALRQTLSKDQLAVTTTTIIPNHNHLLQDCGDQGGALSRYEELGQPFSDKSLEVIGDWLK